MNLKKVVLVIVGLLVILGLSYFVIKGNKTKEEDKDKIKIVTTNFASYDFIRAIIGETKNVNIEFLLGPGKDMHSYEPSASDLIKIQNSDLFVYIGGEAEKWTEKVMSSLETNKTKVICIADYVDTIKEKEIDGAEPEEEEEDEDGAFDEHIWTSPKNAIKMVETLENSIIDIDKENTEKYKENAKSYIKKIEEIDKQIQEIVDNKVRNRLIFADKMPMQYFIDYYKLDVTAAFNGCSSETEPSANTIAYLINKAKEEKVPVILYIELNTGKVANIIAKEVGNNCQAMQIQSLHNVSLADFENGETWVSLMERNLEVLKKALQ